MTADPITIVHADLSLPEHQEATLYLLNAYATDPMGDGQPLSDEVRETVIPGLRRHPTTLVFLAYRNDEPVGLAICFRGFSTFAARPLVNISDYFVFPEHRGAGIGRRLLGAIEQHARELGSAGSHWRCRRTITGHGACMGRQDFPRPCMCPRRAARCFFRSRCRESPVFTSFLCSSTMRTPTFSERLNKLSSQYEQNLAERGEMTAVEELEYHLQLLACYWSRLVGFSNNLPSGPDGLAQSDFGACIQVGSERVHRMIGPDHLIFELWQEYWWRTTILLHKRPTTLEIVETAHKAFEACLARLEFDPWKESRKYWAKDCTE